MGRAAFRHLTLDVDERVLIPRQETEGLVECVLARAQQGVAVDVGTVFDRPPHPLGIELPAKVLK